jgi:DNA methylase
MRKIANAWLELERFVGLTMEAEREVVGSKTSGIANKNEGQRHTIGAGKSVEVDITAPATPEAQRWQGWGTALKPAHEPICVARKPLAGTVASNVLQYGTGALNIDGSRVGTDGGTTRSGESTHLSPSGAFTTGHEISSLNAGRWPANVIHDGSDEVLAGFPNEAGRFFYCAKASKAERNAGLEGLPEKRESDREKDDGVGGDNPRNRPNTSRQNFHPTVKPLALMRYLIKLVTPPGGVVLDPFLGSGTTAVAAILEGFDWKGCEMTDEYWPIIEARVKWAKKETAKGIQQELPL